MPAASPDVRLLGSRPQGFHPPKLNLRLVSIKSGTNAWEPLPPGSRQPCEHAVQARFSARVQNCHPHAKDRGCSFPNCDMPGYLTEVHHVTAWAKTHTTDINDLALACGGHHPLAEQGWTTRTNHHGDTEWIPPASSSSSSQSSFSGWWAVLVRGWP